MPAVSGFGVPSKWPAARSARVRASRRSMRYAVLIWLPKILAHGGRVIQRDLAPVAAHARDTNPSQVLQFGPGWWLRERDEVKYPWEHRGRQNGNRGERVAVCEQSTREEHCRQSTGIRCTEIDGGTAKQLSLSSIG
ncbi:hypothetical protein BC826DRAFT_1181337 [Russula brevipes]|nr:hypothetical protein BC826DRAFT_1181337 [Russula brevipes]